MSHPQILTISPLPTFTIPASNVILPALAAAAAASNPPTTTTTLGDMFAPNDPYFPNNLDVTVQLTSALPTSTSAPGLNSTTLFSTPPTTTAAKWFEQAWIPLVIWLLFAYSLASAIALVWIWCVERWTGNPSIDARYEYRIRQSVVNVQETREDERWEHWRALTEQEQEEAMRRISDQRRYREMSDAAARMGTF